MMMGDYVPEKSAHLQEGDASNCSPVSICIVMTNRFLLQPFNQRLADLLPDRSPMLPHEKVAVIYLQVEPQFCVNRASRNLLTLESIHGFIMLMVQTVGFKASVQGRSLRLLGSVRTQFATMSV